MKRKEFRKAAISAQAIARAIHFAVSQPEDVDTSEIVSRPTASPHRCEKAQHCWA